MAIIETGTGVHTHLYEKNCPVCHDELNGEHSARNATQPKGRDEILMKKFALTVTLPDGTVTKGQVEATDIREVTLMFWQMWFQPDLPSRVDIEETI
jgi:hypothetical protein